MKNLIPHFTIAVIGIVGLLFGGLTGLVVGLVGGYILVTLFGLILFKVSGGILPKKVRIETSKKFVIDYDSLFWEVMPDASFDEKVDYIENLLEQIIRRAATQAPDTHSGMSYHDVDSIIDSVIDEEKNPEKREIIISFWHYLIEEWYSD